MLWVDKHRPHTFKKFVIHTDLADNLQKLVQAGDCPHTLLYGPSGAGKKTIVKALLRETYGASADKIKVDSKPWKIELPNRNIEVELTTVSSNHHVEMNPADVGFRDRYVVQEIIKDMAKNRPLDVNGKASFKMLVLTEVDQLSKEAQHSLRRTMEKCSTVCRLVLLCNNISKVIDPVRSRCMCMRVAAPSDEQVMDVLNHVAKKEGLSLPDELCQRMAVAARGNMRQALLCLECCRVQNYPFQPNQPLHTADWEMYIKEVAADILAEQSPKQLYAVRCKVYELLANCIPPELLIKRLTLELLGKLDDELCATTVKHAADYEHRLQEGSKAIFHIEAFVARFMQVYKEWMLSAFG